MKHKKAQLSLGDAPTVVLIVGFVFLVMATIAYIGEKYGNALDTDNTAATSVNESLAKASTAGITLSTGANAKNGVCGSLTRIMNATGNYEITLANVTQTGCVVKNTTTIANVGSTWLYSYPYTYSAETSASNVTGDLNTEISNNTSIAGIVLTISLVGIVLSILIGIFMAARRGGM